jgi:ribulose-phosphate 3-epimerase
MSRAETLPSLRESGPSLSVAVLTADLLALGSELRLLEKERTKLVHVDVMDGHCCPQLTVGPTFVLAIRTSAFKDVHP